MPGNIIQAKFLHPKHQNSMVAVMAALCIYGTPKRPFAFHDKGLTGAPILGLVQTVRSYPPYIAKPFFGPMMLDRPGEGLTVLGELYDADDERLELIDGLEDIGPQVVSGPAFWSNLKGVVSTPRSSFI